MGYSTQFKGELAFTKELKASQIARLNKIVGEDCRDHPEWNATDLTYMDLEITEDFTGLKWDGSEKTYDLEKKVNVVIQQMRIDDPEFGLAGALAAQGEELEDRWSLVIGDDGLAKKVPVVITGTRITCPHCEQNFILEESQL